MNFTTEPPTTPGFYAWRPTIKDPPNCCDVLDDGTCFLGGIMHRQTVKEIKGEWCRLVPAEEVEKAWLEGLSVGMARPTETRLEWKRSRAKQVAEGKQ